MNLGFSYNLDHYTNALILGTGLISILVSKILPIKAKRYFWLIIRFFFFMPFLGVIGILFFDLNYVFHFLHLSYILSFGCFIGWLYQRIFHPQIIGYPSDPNSVELEFRARMVDAAIIGTSVACCTAAFLFKSEILAVFLFLPLLATPLIAIFARKSTGVPLPALFIDKIGWIILLLTAVTFVDYVVIGFLSRFF